MSAMFVFGVALLSAPTLFKLCATGGFGSSKAFSYHIPNVLIHVVVYDLFLNHKISMTYASKRLLFYGL